MPAKAAAKQPKSVLNKDTPMEVQKIAARKRKQSAVPDTDTFVSQQQDERPSKVCRSTKAATSRQKSRFDAAAASEGQKTASDIPASDRILEKLSALSSTLREVHKCAYQTRCLGTSNEEKIDEVNDLLINTDSSVYELRDGDQQDDILEKLGELESQMTKIKN